MLNLAKVGADLSSDGYAIIPNFLSSADISNGLVDWLKSASKFKDGVITEIPPQFMGAIQNHIQSVIPQVAQAARVDIHPDRYSYCAIRLQQAKDNQAELRQPFTLHRDPKVAEGGVLNWHLDHFSYYLYQDHANWLICYIPILKSDPALANLGIIPYGTLKQLDPKTYTLVEGRGAMRFRCVEEDTFPWFQMRFPSEVISIGDWYAIDDFNDFTMGWKVGFDLEQHKVVPHLSQFDLLIMKADVIHKTNDAGINRISVRCDAMPKHAIDLESWLNILKIIFRLPFISKKHRYNLVNWLKWIIPHKLAVIKR